MILATKLCPFLPILVRARQNETNRALLGMGVGILVARELTALNCLPLDHFLAIVRLFCVGQIAGFGWRSYILSIDALLGHIGLLVSA